MRVTRHPPDKHIQFDYTRHQQRLEQVQYAKYLGITISDDLDWGQHISEISSKATKTLGFLRCNLAFAPRHTKEVAYKTLGNSDWTGGEGTEDSCQVDLQEMEKHQ